MTRQSFLKISAAILLILSALPAPLAAETRDGAAKVERKVGDLALALPGSTRPKRLAPKDGPSRANDPTDLPCPADQIATIFDEDANGNPVPGTEVYFCVWD